VGDVLDGHDAGDSAEFGRICGRGRVIHGGAVVRCPELRGPPDGLARPPLRKGCARSRRFEVEGLHARKPSWAVKSIHDGGGLRIREQRAEFKSVRGPGMGVEEDDVDRLGAAGSGSRAGDTAQSLRSRRSTTSALMNRGSVFSR